MKYIRDYKLFESKEFDDIKTDIEGILVELKDKGLIFDVYKGVAYRKISENPHAVSNIFSIDSNIEGIVIKIENSEIYKTSDLEDYILTVIDYIKIQWDISEIVIYDTGNSGNRNWWNMSTEFSIKFGINRWSWFKLNRKTNSFAISIRKNKI